MKKYIFLFAIVSVFLLSCSSEDQSLKAEIYQSAEGIALDGYDPVAYFVHSEAKLGTEQSSAEYNGLTYYFSSSKNQALFQANPEQYLPEYGGWCAYAVAEGSRKMEPDPSQWQIQDGKLILFTSNLMTKLTGDLKDDWNEEPEEYKIKADKNWEKIK
ncbi:MAG: YHS domain-containing (seleno)protein [Ekhidna sp.]